MQSIIGLLIFQGMDNRSLDMATLGCVFSRHNVLNEKRKKKTHKLLHVSVERVHGCVLPIMASAKLNTEWLVIMKGTMVTWVVMNYHWIPRAVFLAITVSIPVPGNFLKLICKQPLN